jgi:VWFA-related protein
VIVGLLLWLLAAGSLFGQNPDQDAPVFRTGTAWVRLDVQVGDKARLVSDLTRDDFLVYDEGAPQKLLYFGHDSERLDVLLLLDVSGSMRRYLEQMAANAGEALRELAEGDRVAIMLYGRRTRVEEDFTLDRQRIIRELHDSVHESAGLGSGTRTNAALLSAAAYMGEHAQPYSRRAVLILTDNQSMDYLMPDEKVVEALLGADTVLNSIVVGRGERPKPLKPGQYVNPDFNISDVFEMAGQSGGEAVKTERADTTFQQMMESIRTRYSLAYAAPAGAAPGTFRHIRVELSAAARKRYPHAWIRVRSGYTVK